MNAPISTKPAMMPVHRLQVASNLHQFIESNVLPGTGVTAADFWKGFEAIVCDLAPKNIALLAERDRLQLELDGWHKANPGPIGDMKAYRAFLTKIGYLVPPPASVTATAANVDDELALLAGPQLVVPVLNARYALNAANARWGSLYDALYGTDVIPETEGIEKGKGYNPVRGAKVIAFARDTLDQAAPLANGSHKDSTGYSVVDGCLLVGMGAGASSSLNEPAQFIGYQGDAAAPTAILLKHHGLHIDIIIDRSTTIGKLDAAGVSDLVLEAALSTIMDLEDSVAVVDADDHRHRVAVLGEALRRLMQVPAARERRAVVEHVLSVEHVEHRQAHARAQRSRHEHADAAFTGQPRHPIRTENVDVRGQGSQS